MQKAIAFWAAMGRRGWQAVLGAAVGLVGGLGLVEPGRLPKTLWAAEGPVLDNKGNVIQRADRPKVQDLGQAEKLVEEVFGKDITKAKTASEKVKVAGEIIKSAREEQDLAVRYAALQAARRLAVDALDGRLGLEIVREVVRFYQPLEEMSKDDRLAEADRLWQQAARSQGREKLAKQLEAVEQWLYCEITSGLTAKKWEERIREIEAGRDIPDKQMAQKLNGKWVQLVNQKSGLAMSVRGNSKVPTAFRPQEHVVQLPNPQNVPSAYWQIIATPEGHIRFRNCHSGLWLGKNPDPNIPNAPEVAAQQEKPDSNTLWLIKPVENDVIKIMHVATGLYLRPWQGTTQSNYGLHLYPDSNDSSILWILRIAK